MMSVVDLLQLCFVRLVKFFFIPSLQDFYFSHSSNSGSTQPIQGLQLSSLGKMGCTVLTLFFLHSEPGVSGYL